MSVRLRAVPAVLVVALLTAPLAGCASSDPPATTEAGDEARSGPYPLTVDSCGTEVRLEAAPQRIVTIKSSTTELALALGVGDRIVGRAFPDGPFPDALAAEGETVPLLSERVPGLEALLAAEPDLVYAGWESNLSANGAGERATLHGLGIATYVSPAACQGPGYQPDPLTFEDVFTEIRQVGALLDVPDAAEHLIAEQRATLAGVEPLTGGPTALWYSSGSDIPYVGAGIGAPQMILDAAGLTNIFATVRQTWSSVGWEDVVAADPDVIVLVDASWNTAARKVEVLESNPATAQLTAVREQRYLVVPFAASEAGLRNADTVVSLVAQHQALGQHRAQG
ncbi:MAG: putative F420-0 ABC transporter substrate-binding protein [Micrococcales bacterium]|nr:putative F420-0 ABC transporter substrate-binding protein [Micrococcales bacterium]